MDLMTAGVHRHLERVIRANNLRREAGDRLRSAADLPALIAKKAADKVDAIVDLWNRFISRPAFAADRERNTEIARQGMVLVKASAATGADPGVAEDTYVRACIRAGIDQYIALRARYPEETEPVRANRSEIETFLMTLAFPGWHRRRHALAVFGRSSSRRRSSGRRGSSSSSRRSRRRSGSH